MFSTSPQPRTRSPNAVSLAVVAEPITNTPLGDWSAQALCAGKTHLFFGPPGERPSRRRKRETLANAYCSVCPVAEPCRESGRMGNENGMWGGENEEARALAGYTPRATERRSVARAARDARNREAVESDALRQSA